MKEVEKDRTTGERVEVLGFLLWNRPMLCIMHSIKVCGPKQPPSTIWIWGEEEWRNGGMPENAGEMEARRAGKGQRSQRGRRVFPALRPVLQCGQSEGVCRPILRLASANLATFTPRVPLPGPSRATLSRLCFLKQPHFLRTETMTLLSLTYGLI